VRLGSTASRMRT